MICLSFGESMDTSPVEPIIKMAFVPFDAWKSISVRKPSKSTVPSLLKGVINATNDPSTRIFSMIVSSASTRDSELKCGDSAALPETGPPVTDSSTPPIGPEFVPLKADLVPCTDPRRRDNASGNGSPGAASRGWVPHPHGRFAGGFSEPWDREPVLPRVALRYTDEPGSRRWRLGWPSL